ncbi:hypothetical protein VTK26DRAFT_5525 [Humicola hyalothermophila]
MLWYALYPFRGTTEPPVLDPKHPLRRAFSRYGTWAARRVRTVLPISGAVIFISLYLFPFLYTTDAANISSGVSHLPHRVWTDARPLSERAGVEPDVIMRPVWIHGSYMKALERDTLLGALEIQDELLGPTVDFDPRQRAPSSELPDPDDVDLDCRQRDAFHIVNGVTSRSWFFNSPLQYWSGSADAIAADPDLISTVNEKKAQLTTLNTTLRHPIVFSGKRYKERRLIAADALVITLLHLPDSPVGRHWVRKAEVLARAAQTDAKWQVIPPDGRSSSHQLYEFQFRPLSWSDWGLLTLAYSLTLSYLLLRLSKMRAVKSKLGLMITILAQIAASILSSFTVCAILKVDLSRVPYYAYPLVVLAISMENSFRLINAVIMTSSIISIPDRIGEAFGSTAHIAVANRVQNFFVLLGLSRITTPGVAAFCTFAAIGTLFDFFYLATFFLAVLSVDVRQRELFELEKASLKRAKAPHAGMPKQSWINAFRQFRLGETATSTRVAGTIVLIGFVLIAQARYAPEARHQWLKQLLNWPWRSARNGPRPSILVDIHQARSPTSWVHLQDHETAQEVIKVIKPQARSYVARVYDPIIFVLKGADRTPDTKEPLFLPAVYDFVQHEIPQLLVWLLIMLTALRLFTNHLIKDQRRDSPGSPHPDDEPLISVRSLTDGHVLDVAMLAASAGGNLVSVGLDRVIRLWDVPSGVMALIPSDPDVPLENPFPVLSIAVDDKSTWLAFVSWQRVFLWNMEEQQWGTTRKIDLGGHRPQAVFFVYEASDTAPSLVLVKKNGAAIEMEVETETTKEFVICRTPLVWAVAFQEKGSNPYQHQPLSILTASRKNCIHLVRRQESEWVSTEVKLTGKEANGIHCLLPVPALSMYLIGRSRSVDLVDIDSSAIIHTFRTEPMEPRTLKHICLPNPQQPGLASLTLCYVNAETSDLVVHTYSPDTGPDHTIVCNQEDTARRWPQTKETINRIPNPGVWEALPSGNIVGVRRKQGTPTQPPLLSPYSPSTRLRLGLRRRSAATAPANSSHASPVTYSPPRSSSSQEWEAWVLSYCLDPDTAGSGPESSAFETAPLSITAQSADGDGIGSRGRGQLVIAELGPMVRLGATSIAVGFGNVVKVVSAGRERFDSADESGLGGTGMDRGLGSRRKKISAAGSGRSLVVDRGSR